MNPSVPGRLWVHRAICGSVRLLSAIAGWCGMLLARKPSQRVRICIEAGRKGWNLIEYQEIAESAAEFFGVESVVRHEVSDRKRYIRDAHSAILATRPDFYWFDPRSGAQEPLRAVFQSVTLAVVLAWYGVTPIAWLADAPNRVWRLQAEVVTVRRGVCLSFMHPWTGGVRFAHGRIHGPCLFPLSKATLYRLRSDRSQKPAGLDPVVCFVGSLYEPRRSRLETLRDDLARRGVRLDLIAPELTGRRLTNDEYWTALVDSDILITTADHVVSEAQDAVNQPHFIFRYTEALAAGAALVAPIVKGSEEFIRAGHDYLPFESIDEAGEQILELHEDASLRSLIAEQGHEAIVRLIESGIFWRSAVQAAIRGHEIRLNAPFSRTDSGAGSYG